MFCCYLLSDGSYTYIGYTITAQLEQRIHLHNTGKGAKATRRFRGRGKLVCFVSGMKTKGEAMSFEHAAKKAVGLTKRLARIKKLCGMDRWMHVSLHPNPSMDNCSLDC